MVNALVMAAAISHDAPESEAETNQEGLAYEFGLNEMSLRNYEKYVYKNVSAQIKKCPTRKYKSRAYNISI